MLVVFFVTLSVSGRRMFFLSGYWKICTISVTAPFSIIICPVLPVPLPAEKLIALKPLLSVAFVVDCESHVYSSGMVILHLSYFFTLIIKSPPDSGTSILHLDERLNL